MGIIGVGIGVVKASVGRAGMGGANMRKTGVGEANVGGVGVVLVRVGIIDSEIGSKS